MALFQSILTLLLLAGAACLSTLSRAPRALRLAGLSRTAQLFKACPRFFLADRSERDDRGDLTATRYGFLPFSVVHGLHADAEKTGEVGGRETEALTQ